MHRVLRHGLQAALIALAASALLLPEAASQTGDNRAILVVKIPAEAKLIIDGYATKSGGEERTYVSPPLTPGKHYVYKLTMNITLQGKDFSVDKSVHVKAGERVEVAFMDGTFIPLGKSIEAGVPSKFDFPKTIEAGDPAKGFKPAGKAIDPTIKPANKDEAPKDLDKKESGFAPKSRNFLFTYQATVTDLKPGQTAKVWLPMPQTSENQEVTVADSKGLPAGHQIGKEKQYGNQMIFVEAKAGDDGAIPLAVTYKVSRKEVLGGSKLETETAEQLARYLQADVLVPLEGKPLELIKDKVLPKDQKSAAKVMYDVVNTHMKYSKDGKGWGRGDAVWACDSKFGNCTDFHSVFISIARGQKIPAKFEMGFSIPEKRGEGDIGGYHCWAFFKPAGSGWVPVDISEANKFPNLREYYFGNLTEDRVQFTTGRDINLDPKQDGEPLNYFIYPYVEVEGKTYDAAKVTRKFSFKDQ